MSNIDQNLVSDDILETREGISKKAESLTAVYWRRFKKHSLGKIGAIILIILYTVALFADFFSTYDMGWTDKKKPYHPPSSIYFLYKDHTGKTKFKPFSYEMKIVNIAMKEYRIVPPSTFRVITIEPVVGKPEMREVFIESDPVERKQQVMIAVRKHYDLDPDDEKMRELSNAVDQLENDPNPDARMVFKVGTRDIQGKTKELKFHLVKGNKNFLGFFFKGIPYTFTGLFNSRIHFFGSPTGGFYIWGGDKLGRDVFSRLLHGARISLSVGILGALISFSIGLLIGGIAGYFGGVVDNILMRFAEIVISFPSLYLLFTLRAAFPSGLSSTQVYLLIVIILSTIGWASLARIIRGLVLSLKNEDFVLAARTLGLTHLKIIRRHILPNTLSYIIIQATITIPSYILGESALSLLGLGITEPQASWGNMLSVARNYRVVNDFPWILIPGVAIFLSIMAWNFFGDGIRDAVDPRSKH